MSIGVINKASATVVEDELKRKRNDMVAALRKKEKPVETRKRNG